MKGSCVSTLCPSCQQWHERLIRDRAGNERGCPSCLSLERHRLLALLLPAIAAAQAGEDAGDTGDAAGTGDRERLVVDVAPSLALDATLDALPGSRRLRMDFDPDADGRLVDVRASVTALPLAAGSVDLLVCSHVLEHVPDDRAGMRELARVLHEDGIGVVVVPWREGPTDEDPEASVEERIRRFGQADHVRYYGDDFEDRLRESGLAIQTLRTVDLAPDWVIKLTRLMPNERFWLVQRDGVPRKLPTPDELGANLGEQVAEAMRVAATRSRERIEQATAEISALTRDRDDADARARTWRRRYKALRGRRAVRLLFRLDAVLKRVRALRR